MSEDAQRRAMRLDPSSLRGLAHPLRVRILEMLRSDGASTATKLSKQLGEDSGNVSWHLRQLAEHGFVAEDFDRGTRRERWWYARHDYTAIDTTDFLADNDLRGLLSILKSEVLKQQFHRAAGFVSEEWPVEWQEAAGLGYWKLRLNLAELANLRDDLSALLDRYEHLNDEQEEDSGESAGDDDRHDVVFQFQTFPRASS